VLIAICAAGAALRVYFVARHKAHERNGRTSPVAAAVGLLTLAGVAVALMPPRPAVGPTAPEFTRIQSIVAQRCISCHSTTPTQPGFATAPNDVRLDTPAGILAHAAQMRQQIATRAMPLGNITGITEEERAEMLAWIDRGAPH
jgi:uncharacterized membrane protein